MWCLCKRAQKKVIVEPDNCNTLSGDKGVHCMWDDTDSKCIRENCPYRHASEVEVQNGYESQDLFELIPCTFAGMSEGCKWHRNRLRAQNWVVPPFELGETNEEPAPALAAEGVELVPEYDGDSCKWFLQAGTSSSSPIASSEKEQKEVAAEIARWAKDLESATTKFLYSHEIEENDFV